MGSQVTYRDRREHTTIEALRQRLPDIRFGLQLGITRPGDL
jgi:hypothetical protein